MTKKQKIIAIISFLLLVFPFITSAGSICTNDQAIISSNNIDLDCIDVTTDLCNAIIYVTNNCEESFFYYNKPDDSEFNSTAKTLINDKLVEINNKFVEIPPNWKLNIHIYNNELFIALSDKKQSFPVSYKDNKLLSNNFLLKFGEDKTIKKYTITGYYKKYETEDEKEIQLGMVRFKYIVFFLIIFIPFFLLICFVANKYKIKNKK